MKNHWTEFKIQFFGWSITLREIIASTVILAIMMIIGYSVSESIIEAQARQNAIYTKALQIDTKEMFEYGMNTNVGNAFVYGDLVAVDPVTYDEIGGQYMSVEKVTEEYTRHSREVDDYDDEGNKVGSHTEYYYTWDTIDRDGKHCTRVTFLGVEFDYGQIATFSGSHIKTIKDKWDSDIRYVYYGSSITHTGTAFCKLSNGTVHEVDWHGGQTIQEAYDSLHSEGGEYIFWVFWIALTGGLMYAFYYADNNWLH